MSKKREKVRKETDERDKHERGGSREKGEVRKKERQEEEKRDGKGALERGGEENSPEGVLKEISLLKLKHQHFQMMKLNTFSH